MAHHKPDFGIGELLRSTSGTDPIPGFAPRMQVQAQSILQSCPFRFSVDLFYEEFMHDPQNMRYNDLGPTRLLTRPVILRLPFPPALAY